MIQLIACVGQNLELGHHGEMPWGMSMKADLRYFREMTTNQVILMGSKTYASIGKPLPNRTTLVLTRNVLKTKQLIDREEVVVVGSVQDALQWCKENKKRELFIAGGADIYRLFLPYAEKVHLTEIHETFQADTFFPAMVSNEWEKVRVKEGVQDEQTPFPHDFYEYTRKK